MGPGPGFLAGQVHQAECSGPPRSACGCTWAGAGGVCVRVSKCTHTRALGRMRMRGALPPWPVHPQPAAGLLSPGISAPSGEEVVVLSLPSCRAAQVG